MIEKLDGLCVVPGFFQQRGGGIEILERVPDSHHQAMQQIEGSGGVARSEANLGKSQEVGRHERVLFNLAGKDQFENLARRQLVAGFKQLAGSSTQNLRRGRFLRFRAIRGELCIKSSELRRDL